MLSARERLRRAIKDVAGSRDSTGVRRGAGGRLGEGPRSYCCCAVALLICTQAPEADLFFSFFLTKQLISRPFVVFLSKTRNGVLACGRRN